MKTQHVPCNTQQKWTSSDNGPSCPTDTGCLWNLHMCCQHNQSTGCSSPSLRGRPVSELCRRRPGTAESAAAGLRAQVRKRLLDWKRLWWCCTVRARDICGVQKELRWVLGGAVLVGTSRRTILAPLSGLQLGALGLVSGEAGLLARVGQLLTLLTPTTSSTRPASRHPARHLSHRAGCSSQQQQQQQQQCV